MKGAIGNALILNIVITFVIIFLLLVVGSMAYTKAYKVKNYLLVEVTKYVENNDHYNFVSFHNDAEINKWDEIVNPYLGKTGYSLATSSTSCPKKYNDYNVVVKNDLGRYDYCIYKRESDEGDLKSSTYMILAYMKLDLPAVGNYIRIPIKGETKNFIKRVE